MAFSTTTSSITAPTSTAYPTTPFALTISTPVLDEALHSAQALCFNLGIQFGLTTLLLIILLLLTRPSKRCTSVFILNALALTFASIRTECQALYFTSPDFSSISDTIATGPWTLQEHTWQATARVQVAAAIFSALQATCVELSLFLQVRAVCAPMTRLWARNLVLGLTGAIAVANMLLAWLFSIVSAVMLASEIPVFAREMTGWWQLTSWTYQASVVYFSAVFCGKLMWVIARRRRLGITRFGPMHIVTIMGTQTMLIPAIFCIMAPFVELPELASLSLTIVTIFLPLSAVWAGEAVPEEQSSAVSPTNSTPSFRAKLFGGAAKRLNSTTPSADTPSFVSPSSSRILSWRKPMAQVADEREVVSEDFV